MKVPAPVLMLAAMAMLLGPMGPGRSVSAAYLSEVFFDDRGHQGVPHAVELHELDRLASDFAELLVVDARLDIAGQLLRIIPIPTDQSVLLVSEQAWPESIWGWEINTSTSHRLLEELTGEAEMFFSGARTLMLYDRPTGLVEDLSVDVFSEAVQESLEAELLEAMTFAYPESVVDAEASAWGPVLSVDAGHAIVRPRDADGQRGPDLIAGMMTETGTLAGTDPPLALTPTRLNPSWKPIPEPSTVVAMLVLWGLLAVRGRCSRGHGRLS